MVEEVEGGEGGVVPQPLVEVEGGELGRKERAPEEHQRRRHLEVQVFPSTAVIRQPCVPRPAVIRQPCVPQHSCD